MKYVMAVMLMCLSSFSKAEAGSSTECELVFSGGVVTESDLLARAQSNARQQR